MEKKEIIGMIIDVYQDFLDDHAAEIQERGDEYVIAGETYDQLAEKLSDIVDSACEKDSIEVRTRAGILRAYADHSSDYPAVSIMLEPCGADYEIDLMSAEVHEADKDASVYGYLYEDVFSEDCTRRIEWRDPDIRQLVEQIENEN